MDFSVRFTVEIYGDKGWEVVNMALSWDDAIVLAKAYCNEFQVRITSPFREKLEDDLAKIRADYVKGLITDEEFMEMTFVSISERVSGKTARDLR